MSEDGIRSEQATKCEELPHRRHEERRERGHDGRAVSEGEPFYRKDSPSVGYMETTQVPGSLESPHRIFPKEKYDPASEREST